MQILLTLERQTWRSKVELDGQDISRHVRRIEIDADPHRSTVRLTVAADVVVVGEPGTLEFQSRDDASIEK